MLRAMKLTATFEVTGFERAGNRGENGLRVKGYFHPPPNDTHDAIDAYSGGMDFILHHEDGQPPLKLGDKLTVTVESP